MLLVQSLTTRGGITTGHAVGVLVQEIVGGAVAGLVGGYALLWLLRQLPVDVAIYPVLALTSVLFVFGGAQTIGTSGFLAVYFMGVIVGINKFEAHRALVYASEAFGWLAQIALFLLLGLLVTPHRLLPLVAPILAVTVILLLVARPVATFVCLLPFRYSGREAAFASWVGLRGAVPIYLTIIPVLSGVRHADALFGAVVGVVIASLFLQGWTIAPVGRILGFGKIPA
jgi:cell volume regulation protein A